jgi:alpha-1,3-mannosyltransferase
VTIENGVNVSKWKNCGSVTAKRSMIFVGRWSENKAVPVLIDLIAELKKQGTSWSLIIVGIAGEQTAAQLTACAEKCGVASQVQIHEKPSEAQIGELMGQASYIASASRYEGFGISAVEGLSAGLVPLLSPIPPFDKLRQALGLGAVINENDLAQSAQDIERLHAHIEPDIRAIREECMALAGQYDWAGVTDRFVDVYRNVLKLSESSAVGKNADA